LISAEHDEASSRRTRDDGESIGVGIVGEHELGLHGLGEREREIECSRLLRIGKVDGGKAAVRLRLLGDHMNVSEPSSRQGA